METERKMKNKRAETVRKRSKERQRNKPVRKMKEETAGRGVQGVG